MELISKKIIDTVERAYNSQSECDEDVAKMKDEGYAVVSDHHDIYEFYRKFEKKIHEYFHMDNNMSGDKECPQCNQVTLVDEGSNEWTCLDPACGYSYK